MKKIRSLSKLLPFRASQKVLFLSASLVLSCLVSSAQLITISANPGTSGNTPMGQSLYSAIESIYLQNEINAAMTINRLNYSCATLSTGSNTYNNFAIYMKTTTATVLATGTYSLTGYTLVYNGPISWSATGWSGVNLTTTFPYSNTPGQHLSILTIRTDALAHPGNQFNCALGNATAGSAALSSRRYFSSAVPVAGSTSLAATNFRPAIQVGQVYPNDIGVGNIYTLGKMPIEYGAPTVIQALIRNEGSNTMTNIAVQAYITGANTFVDNVNIPSLAAGASTVVSFANYSPTSLSTGDQVVVSTNTSGDQNPANDVKTWSMDITQNLYSYKNQAIPNAGGVGFNGGTGDFVAKFNSNPGVTPPYTNPPEINEIKVDLTTSGLTYQLGIWNANGVGGTPGTLLWTSPVLTSAVGTAFVPVPNISVSGDYFVGVRQTGTTNIGFAYQSENPIRSQTFYYTSPTGSATWTDFAPNSPFRFSIEVQVRIPTPPNCAINYLPANNTSITCYNPVLSWQSGGGAPTGFDVYFGTDSAQVAASNPAYKVSTNQAGLSYTPTGVLPNTTYYWKIIPQNPDGFATGCAVESFTTGSFSNCYCIPSYTGTACTGAITNVVLNTLSNASACVAPSHTIYPGTGSLTTSLEQNGTYNISVTCNDTNIVSVWIDYNQNGLLEATEWNQVTTTGSANTASSANITIPATATLGNTLMRVRSRLANNVNGSGDACTAFGSGESEDYVVTIIPPTPCSGTPAPGNTIASASSVCPGSVVNFSLQYPTNGVGVSYQWNNNSGPIAGATNNTFSMTITQAEDIFCEVICGGNSGFSNIVSIAINNFYDCYCASLATTTADEEIYNFTLNGVSSDPNYSGANACANVAPGAGSILNRYSNFKSLGALTSMTAGSTISFTVEENECDGPTYYAFGTGIWIDYNHNGSFADAGENVFLETSTGIGPRNVTGSFTIPGTALTGLTGIRVIVAEGFAGASLTPCLQYGYGETEDYLIEITQPVPCAGTPTPGNTIASASSVCPPATVNFSLQNNTVGTGVTYQWYDQSGPIAGATTSTYSQSISTANSFYCEVTCSGQTGTSSTAAVTINAPTTCYCTPVTSCNFPDIITNVTFAGINRSSTCDNASGGYSFFNSAPNIGNVTAGSTYTISVSTGGDLEGAAVWIDFDQNGIFDGTELVLNGYTGLNPATYTANVAVPSNAVGGTTRMRVRCVYLQDPSASVGPCANTNFGETEDYAIIVTPSTTTLSLTCFIQGYWDGTSAMNPTLFNQGQSNPTTDCDSILVELRTASSPTTVAYSTMAVLQTNGTASCVYPSGVANGYYYIVIKHRNAIETWSADSLLIGGASASYNFSTAASQAYGSNQVELTTANIPNGIFAIFSGDIVKDAGEATDLLDLNQLETEVNNFSFGYFSEDLNGDGNVDILDAPALEGNISGFVFSQHP